jgi:hypothetical protein
MKHCSRIAPGESLPELSSNLDLFIKLDSRMPERDQIVQEEKLRRDIMNLVGDISEKLKNMQEDFDAPSSTAKRVGSLSIGGIE